MRKLLILIFLMMTISWTDSYAQQPLVCVGEEDSSPDPNALCVWSIKFSNGAVTDNGDGTASISTSGTGAPTTADYLVGTANGSLSAEIVVGTTPGGELGNTWASPTLDDGITVSTWSLGTPTVTGTMLLSGTINASSTGNIILLTATSLPASCFNGEIGYDSNATSGQRLYVCESGTWVLQGDGGSAEVNNLETITTNIQTTEIPIGTAANTAVYTAISGQSTMTNGGVMTNTDMTCTDCIGTTEIADSYILNTGDTITGNLDIGGTLGLSRTTDPLITFLGNRDADSKWTIGVNDDAGNDADDLFYISAGNSLNSPLLAMNTGGRVGVGTTAIAGSKVNGLMVVAGTMQMDNTGTLSQLIMVSPDGTCSKCTVTNADAFTCASFTCP